ncbi:MAG: ATP-binding cassette domain-containing protein [Cyclobacteriaceae bacterium]
MKLSALTSTFAPMSIEVRNLSKYYGDKPAVDRISFSVRKGEVAGFLGPNGAGKSTTMKIITTYLEGSEGQVFVAGKEVTAESAWVKNQIGYLPEQNPLYTDLYVHEYLEYSGSLYGLGGRQLRERVGEMVERCGLTREQNKKIEELSRGYRQRVGLAQALLHNPPILILDEPTSGLDPNQLTEIRQLIREVSADKTVLFSTHIMQEVEAICDRVIVINAGKIVADDSLSNLLGQKGSLLVAQFGVTIDPELFYDIPGLLACEVGPDNTILFKAESVDLRPAIFKRVADRQLPLLSLDKKENSMEEVFRALTTLNTNPSAS